MKNTIVEIWTRWMKGLPEPRNMVSSERHDKTPYNCAMIDRLCSNGLKIIIAHKDKKE